MALNLSARIVSGPKAVAGTKHAVVTALRGPAISQSTRCASCGSDTRRSLFRGLAAGGAVLLMSGNGTSRGLAVAASASKIEQVKNLHCKHVLIIYLLDLWMKAHSAI